MMVCCVLGWQDLPLWFLWFLLGVLLVFHSIHYCGGGGVWVLWFVLVSEVVVLEMLLGSPASLCVSTFSIVSSFSFAGATVYPNLFSLSLLEMFKPIRSSMLSVFLVCGGASLVFPMVTVIHWLVFVMLVLVWWWLELVSLLKEVLVRILVSASTVSPDVVGTAAVTAAVAVEMLLTLLFFVLLSPYSLYLRQLIFKCLLLPQSSTLASFLPQ